MRRLVLAATLSAAAPPAPGAELDLMVGFRSVMAAGIREEGYNCPDVKRIVDAGPDRFGSVLKVVCGPVGRDEGLGRSALAGHGLSRRRLHGKALAEPLSRCATRAPAALRGRASADLNPAWDRGV